MIAAMKERPSIPEPIKRAVRQACGFGCILCGYPIYDYDHVVPYATTEEHTIENLCLLCGRHHTEKNRGLLPVEKVREARLDPINKRTGVSEAEYLHYSGKSCIVRLGNYVATNDLSFMEGSYCALVIANEKLSELRLHDTQAG
jgi:5-methylcytosine-specific restriction endonuclease McrA